MQLVIQAANNRKKKAFIEVPRPYQVIHLQPSTLQGVATNAHLWAVFPTSSDHIKVTFHVDAAEAEFDFDKQSSITWNGSPPKSTVTIPRNSGKFTLDIRGLRLLVSLH